MGGAKRSAVSSQKFNRGFAGNPLKGGGLRKEGVHLDAPTRPPPLYCGSAGSSSVW
jgi:hypothetical protein